jgi:prepilin-type N-terminal cleavage/methylation domain-containing protein/prepilin-type processing-associated H-X9-DG protein
LPAGFLCLRHLIQRIIPTVRPQPSTRGFTLIELLVVIAIIAILASLLLPALSRAKDSAHATTCRNNLRQVSLGSQLYVNDFATHVPFWSFPQMDPNGSMGLVRHWFETLEPYIGARWPECTDPVFQTWHPLAAKMSAKPKNGIYVCPGYNRLNVVYGGKAGDPFLGGAYAYNWNGMGRNTAIQSGGKYSLGLGGSYDASARTHFALARESEVIAPSEMIAFGDAALGFPSEERIGVVFLEWGLSDRSLTGHSFDAQEKQLRLSRYSRRHAGSKFNLSFADGHVEYLPPTKAFNFRNAAVARRWNRDHSPHPELILERSMF